MLHLRLMKSSSSSPDESVDEFLRNKRKHISSSSEDSREGWRRLKKESKNGSSVSTSLKLYEDPWKIKKTLTESDLGILSRLLLSADMVKNHMLPMLGGEDARAVESEEGAEVRVLDMDTKSMHQLMLKRWSSSKSYVLIGKWSQDFVRRRELHKGDEIGLYWDPYSSLFNFCVLKRANCP
ncbi:B3 domain-containing protein At2g33720-like [Neltuma alba]|uniref:B3 domain-containing protein At2g33720-like n=1 Tax=Neltuma alba TaxID=207710 RepID=UPI0010A41010|nr:B3 domain-containing protein At2g33720-like [Prosopis alba]XP_028780550.1 B3 domain-containing protein At2g33720-like [Prosopis alba]